MSHSPHFFATAFPAPSATHRRAGAWVALVVLVLLATVLAGCAGPRLINVDVTSFGNWPEARAPGSFAFERLPSQEAQPELQAQLEDAALTALSVAGFSPAATGAAADVLVQVGVRTLRYDRGPYYGDPFFYSSAFRGGRWRGGGVGLGYGYGRGPTWYVTEVSLLLRDGRTKQVLYETRAQYDGTWADDAVRAALFEAAMKDFPRPAISPRRVVVQLAPR